MKIDRINKMILGEKQQIEELQAEERGVEESVSDLQARVSQLESLILKLSQRETAVEEEETRIRKKVGLRKKTVLTDEQKEKRSEALAKGRATSKANRAEKKKEDRIEFENVEDKRTTRGIGVSKRRKKALEGSS